MIKDLKTLKEFFKKKIKTPIFGVCVYAFDRLGPEEFISQYELLALRYSLDTKLIEKDLPVLSLEKGRGIDHLDVPRNSTSVLAHPKTQEYLKKFTNPLIIPYKSSVRMMKMAKDKSWIIAANPPKFGKEFLEDKLKFRRILETIGVAVPPGKVVEINSLDYDQSVRAYGQPFFVQYPLSGGGKGNFLIKNRQDFRAAVKNLREISQDKESKILVAQFIKGSSPSLTGCVTKRGILSTSLQYQVLNAAELYNKQDCFGIFCGHDWTAVDFSIEVEKQAYDIVEKVGQCLKKLGYKGIFGLDFVLDQKTQMLYVVECNPRLLGSFPTITMAQMRNNEPPILGFHILEFLGIDYELDVKAVNSAMRKRKISAQMLLHNLEDKLVESTKEIKPGVYCLKNGEIKFLRDGYKLSHLKIDNEFLITEGVSIKGSYFSPNRRLVRILTLRSVLADGKHLNTWAKKIIKLIYNSFGLKPIRFCWLKRLLKPGYLVRG